MTLTLTANDPQATSYTVLAGSGADVWTLTAANWGNPTWDTQYTAPRGTLGARPTSASIQNRAVSLNLRLLRHADVNAASGHLRDLQLTVDRMRKYGGRVTYQPAGRTYRQHLEVYAGSGGMADWTNQVEHRARYEVTLAFACSPYVLGDSMHLVDDFTVNTEAEYVFDRGSGANVAVSGGQLELTGTNVNVAMVRTSGAYALGDQQVMARVVPSTAGVGGHFCGVIAKRVAANQFLFCEVSNGTFELAKWDGGKTALASTPPGTNPATGRPYTVLIRVEGNVVYAEYWATTTEYRLGGTATASITHTLDATNRALFGEGTTGYGGLALYDTDAGVRVDSLEVRPYVYRGANFTGWSAPDEFRLDGDIPGDAPALTTIEVAGEGVSGDHTRFGMVAWSRRPATHNLIADGGDFEMGVPGAPATVPGTWWTIAGVTGVTGAATSQTRTAGGRYGGWCNQVVAPATANTGVACAMYRRFRAGVTYTAEAWVRAASGSTNARIRLGVSGDIASETAAALSASWVRRTVTWTPTATTNVAYFAAEITAATSTTFQLDGVRVYEGTTAPTLQSQAEGYGGRPPYGIVDAGEEYIDGSNIALVTGASATDYRHGRYLDWGIVSYGAGVLIDPTLIPTDDHATGLDVEVWALGFFPDTETYTAFLLPWGDSGATPPSKGTGKVWTREYGSGGVSTAIIEPLYGWLRFGTLPFDPPAATDDVAKPVLLVLHATANTNNLITAVALVPSRARALSPTNKADNTDYPRFSVGTDAFHRRFTPELRGMYRPENSPWRQGPGLGGSLLEIEPGPTNIVLAASRYIPGTTSSSITKYRMNAAIAVTPTPRWHHVRDE
jgi:hypothetical protein